MGDASHVISTSPPRRSNWLSPSQQTHPPPASRPEPSCPPSSSTPPPDPPPEDESSRAKHIKRPRPSPGDAGPSTQRRAAGRSNNSPSALTQGRPKRRRLVENMLTQAINHQMTSNYQANVAVDSALSDTTPEHVETRITLVRPMMDPPSPSQYVTLETFTSAMESVGQMFKELKDLLAKAVEQRAMQAPAAGFVQIDPTMAPPLTSHIVDAVRDQPWYQRHADPLPFKDSSACTSITLLPFSLLRDRQSLAGLHPPVCLDHCLH